MLIEILADQKNRPVLDDSKIVSYFRISEHQ